MKTLILSLFLCFDIGCSAAEPAKTKPLFPAAVTCFIGKVDSRSSCTSTMTKVPDLDPKGRWSSGLTCGRPGQVSELKWEFLGSDAGVDVYQINRRFPADTPRSVNVSKTIRFSGKRLIVFEDEYQVIVFDSAKEATK